MPSKRKLVAAGAICLVVVVAAAVTYRTHASAPMRKAAAALPAVEVDVAAVISQTIIDYQSYSGRIEAVHNVEIRPLVSGTIVAVHFRDGATVRKGDPLFTI